MQCSSREFHCMPLLENPYVACVYISYMFKFNPLLHVLNPWSYEWNLPEEKNQSITLFIEAAQTLNHLPCWGKPAIHSREASSFQWILFASCGFTSVSVHNCHVSFITPQECACVRVMRVGGVFSFLGDEISAETHMYTEAFEQLMQHIH